MLCKTDNDFFQAAAASPVALGASAEDNITHESNFLQKSQKSGKDGKTKNTQFALNKTDNEPFQSASPSELEASPVALGGNTGGKISPPKSNFLQENQKSWKDDETKNTQFVRELHSVFKWPYLFTGFSC